MSNLNTFVMICDEPSKGSRYLPTAVLIHNLDFGMYLVQLIAKNNGVFFPNRNESIAKYREKYTANPEQLEYFQKNDTRFNLLIDNIAACMTELTLYRSANDIELAKKADKVRVFLQSKDLSVLKRNIPKDPATLYEDVIQTLLSEYKELITAEEARKLMHLLESYNEDLF